MPNEIKDKNGQPIKEGEEVFTKIRGGTHTGTVEKVVTSQEEAEKEGVKNPPKVRESALRRYRSCILLTTLTGPVHGSTRSPC